tara:strand:- start:245 stop:691 length:447 start_codon:yes stop_codon:yes gene_type:complete
MEWHRDTFTITDDPGRVDVDTVIRLLHEKTYWARDIPPGAISCAIGNSLCFSILDGEKLIGFARVITDHAVFGYLEDVIIDSDYRGRGLGQWLLDCMLAHPTVSSLKKLMLATEDAHGLYEKYGFTAPGHPEWIMERYNDRAFETNST